MRLHARYILFVLITLLTSSIGCSNSRRHLANSVSATSLISRPSGNTYTKTAFAESGDAPSAVQAVAYRVNDTGELGDYPPDASAQLAAPIEVEFISPGQPGLTLEAIEQLALANNPAIRQASAASVRARGIQAQVGLKPNPTVGYNGTQLADAGTDQHTVFIAQTFVRGDKLAWNQRVIGHDVNIMNWQVESQRQRVRTDIRLAFYEALAAQKRLQLAREFRRVAEKGVTASEDRLDAKVGTRADVLQSEIQLNEVILSIQQSEFELSAAFYELAALAGVSELETTTLIGDLTDDLNRREAEAEFAQIVATSPQLAAARASVDRARANLQRQRLQPTPNISAQVGSGYDSATGQGLVNAQLSLPLPVHNRNQGNIRAAQAEFHAARQNVERILQGIRRDLALVMREFYVAEATVRKYKGVILPRARETLKLMQEAQDAGQFDFLRVLTARRAYFDASLKYVEAMGRLAQANAKIDGLLLTGGLSNVVAYGVGDELRGQALSGQ